MLEMLAVNNKLLEAQSSLKEAASLVVGYRPGDPVNLVNLLAYANHVLGTAFQPDQLRCDNPTVLVEMPLWGALCFHLRACIRDTPNAGESLVEFGRYRPLKPEGLPGLPLQMMSAALAQRYRHTALDPVRLQQLIAEITDLFYFACKEALQSTNMQTWVEYVRRMTPTVRALTNQLENALYAVGQSCALAREKYAAELRLLEQPSDQVTSKHALAAYQQGTIGMHKELNNGHCRDSRRAGGGHRVGMQQGPKKSNPRVRQNKESTAGKCDKCGEAVEVGTFAVHNKKCSKRNPTNS